MKPVFKTTWEIGTTWKLRTVTSVPRHIQYIAIDLGYKTTSEFRTVFHSPLDVPNSQVSLYLYSQNTLFYQIRVSAGTVYCAANLPWYCSIVVAAAFTYTIAYHQIKYAMYVYFKNKHYIHTWCVTYVTTIQNSQQSMNKMIARSIRQYTHIILWQYCVHTYTQQFVNN